MTRALRAWHVVDGAGVQVESYGRLGADARQASGSFPEMYNLLRIRGNFTKHLAVTRMFMGPIG